METALSSAITSAWNSCRCRRKDRDTAIGTDVSGWGPTRRRCKLHGLGDEEGDTLLVQPVENPARPASECAGMRFMPSRLSPAVSPPFPALNSIDRFGADHVNQVNQQPVLRHAVPVLRRGGTTCAPAHVGQPEYDVPPRNHHLIWMPHEYRSTVREHKFKRLERLLSNQVL